MGPRPGMVLGFAAAAVLLAAGLGAVESSLEVRLDPREFGIEDVARLTVRITEPSGNPEVDLGDLNNLEIVSGPSTNTEFSWVNGASTRSVSFNYVLQGKSVGKASLGPVTVTLGEQVLTAERVAAEVVPGSVVPQRRSRGRSPFGSDPFEDLFGRRQPARSVRVALRQLVTHQEVALGETVIATIVLDTTAGAPDGFEWVTPPAFPGWWAQRVEPPERIAGEVVEVDGVRFNRFVVARNVLVPLKTGSVSVPSVSARIGFRNASVFGPQQVVERSSRERVIEVSSRPPMTDGFAGAVGDLRYTASVEPKTIKFGESAVVTIRLRGNGNLPMVEAPALWPNCTDCETYPPEEDSNFKVDAQGIHGSRTWSMTLVPRIPGALELKPVQLAVFDPSAGTYQKQTIGPLHLEVVAPEPTPAPVASADQTPEAAEEQEAVSEDAPGVAVGGTPTWVWIAGALLLGGLAGGVVPLIISRRRRSGLPPRRSGESPAERARELHIALERWWLDARDRPKGRPLEEEMNRLRRELEAIRFAPGRADHTETVVDLEERLRGLMRRA